jgi:hypothetical protein
VSAQPLHSSTGSGETDRSLAEGGTLQSCATEIGYMGDDSN